MGPIFSAYLWSKACRTLLDDAAIAHLLGHRGMNCVYRYRRASSQHLKEETKKCRETIDEILEKYNKSVGMILVVHCLDD